MTQNFIVPTILQSEPEIEQLLQRADAEIKTFAQRSARHFAMENRPSPTGDSLLAYIPEIKSGYERTAADALRMIQSETHFPEGNLDIERAKQKQAVLDWEIEDLEKKIDREQPMFEGFDQHEVDIWKRKIIWIIILMMAGETVYNTGAFQVISENLLFSLILSVAVTVAVILAGHTAASLYKKAQNMSQRIGIVVSSLVIMSIVFYGFAYLRTWFLKSHHVEINPWLFMLFNLFFFIVMCLVSYFFLPTWEEMKKGRRMLSLFEKLKKKKDELQQKKSTKENLKDVLHVMSKARVRSIHYAKYVTDSISARYREAIGIFIATNNRYRTDHKTPDCFKEPIPELNIDEDYFKSSALNRKQH